MWLRKYFGGAGGAVRRPSRAYSAMRRESGYPDFGHNGHGPKRSKQAISGGGQRHLIVVKQSPLVGATTEPA
jgi:hypothetical protein